MYEGGIFANTRIEWARSDVAILAAGGVVTTVSSSSSEQPGPLLLGDPGARGLVVENHDLLGRVREYVSRELQRINRQFESRGTIERFRLVSVEFTGENDLLTPSLKHERRNVAERFTDRIEGKYAAAEEPEEEAAA
jgi:long-subunit acyl-CoA synthetase (AMP-forming)